jgi:hypothetical protein
MTETAALTQEERAEIRALVEQCAWAGAKLDVSDVRSAIAATNLDAAAATISRLLDALEAAERERDVRDRAAQDLCRIYFEIAEEAIGGDEVRRQRDERIGRLLAERSADAA